MTRRDLPGAVFHVTSRTQGHQAWFTEPLRTRIVYALAGVLPGLDGARLFAYAVMPNHLHLVIRQGDAPLGWTLQPFLRRVALMVQSVHGVIGHVFERRFRSHACMTPDHLRAAIVYTHLNPVRARLCRAPGDYPWTSYRRFVGHRAGDRWPYVDLALEDAIGIFATAPDRSLTRLHTDYREYAAWRQRLDAEPTHQDPPVNSESHDGPDTRWGD